MQRSPVRMKKSETNLLLRGHSSDSDDEVDYEDALQECGYGRFHYLLLFICGWANASDAIEIICISFLLPSAECDLDLSADRKGWLSAILFVGMMIGGYVWGSLGDSIGRRNVLINAMVVNAVAGIGSSFAQEFYLFLFMRFLSGVGVGGSIPVVWTYFAEFQPSQKRGGALSFLASFWMVGNVAVAGLAWAVIPRELGWSGQDGAFQFNSWRIFVVLAAAPSLLVAIGLLFLPESPKFLLSKGKHNQAIQVLSAMYSSNTGKPSSSYPVKQLICSEVSPHIKHSRQEGGWKAVVAEALSNTAKLFTSKSLFRVTMIMIIINFSIQFGYYGLWLWFPELFSKLQTYYDDHPGESISVCEVVDSGYVSNATSSVSCADREPTKDQVFINSFIISLSAAPSNLWTILMMDKLGRKFFLCLSMVLSGGCAFLIYLVNSSTMNLILSCVFGAVSTMGFNALDCLGIELFPTSLRGTAMAITLVSARIGAILGNLVFGYLVETYCAIPILMVATLLIGGGLMSILLPNTTLKPLL